MKLPRGVTEKHGRQYGRVHTKRGGEISFPLGPTGAVVTQRFYAIRALIRVAEAKGLADDDIRAALREETLHDIIATPPTPEPEPAAPERTVTLEEAARRWLAERIDLELETRNAAIIRSRVERLLLPCVGEKALASFRRTNCHAYLAQLRRTRPDLKPGSLHHYLRDLRELLAWAEEVSLIEGWQSPWPKKRIMPRVAKRPPDRLTDEEVSVLVSLPDHWGFTLRFLLATGLRWGEACRARRRDIQDRHLLIRKSKSGEPRRVPLSHAILEEIVRQGGDWIVPRQRNAPGGRSERSSSSFNATIRRLVEKHLKTLSAKDRKPLEALYTFHAHRCRHTFATKYLEGRGSITMLSKILGHASVKQTEVYGRPDAAAIQADADRVFERWEERTG